MARKCVSFIFPNGKSFEMCFDCYFGDEFLASGMMIV